MFHLEHTHMEWALFRLHSERRYQTCFSHWGPRNSLLSGQLGKLQGIVSEEILLFQIVEQQQKDFRKND